MMSGMPVPSLLVSAKSESSSQSVEHMSYSSQSEETAMTVDDADYIYNMPCAVCLDRGSGFHYGVYTCEGCKVGSVDFWVYYYRLHPHFTEGDLLNYKSTLLCSRFFAQENWCCKCIL